MGHTESGARSLESGAEIEIGIGTGIEKQEVGRQKSVVRKIFPPLAGGI